MAERGETRGDTGEMAEDRSGVAGGREKPALEASKIARPPEPQNTGELYGQESRLMIPVLLNAHLHSIQNTE